MITLEVPSSASVIGANEYYFVQIQISTSTQSSTTTFVRQRIKLTAFSRQTVTSAFTFGQDPLNQQHYFAGYGSSFQVESSYKFSLSGTNEIGFIAQRFADQNACFQLPEQADSIPEYINDLSWNYTLVQLTSSSSSLSISTTNYDLQLMQTNFLATACQLVSQSKSATSPSTSRALITYYIGSGTIKLTTFSARTFTPFCIDSNITYSITSGQSFVWLDTSKVGLFQNGSLSIYINTNNTLDAQSSTLSIQAISQKDPSLYSVMKFPLNVSACPPNTVIVPEIIPNTTQTCGQAFNLTWPTFQVFSHTLPFAKCQMSYSLLQSGSIYSFDTYPTFFGNDSLTSMSFPGFNLTDTASLDLILDVTLENQAVAQIPFTIFINNPCNTLSIQSSKPGNQTYTIGSGPALYSSALWNSTLPQLCKIQFSLNITPALASNDFQLSVTNESIIISYNTDSYQLVGTNIKVKLQGLIGPRQKSNQFYVLIGTPCQIAAITPAFQNITIEISNSPFSWSFSGWSINNSDCSPFSFSASLLDGTPFPITFPNGDFINFDDSNTDFIFMAQSSNFSLVGFKMGVTVAGITNFPTIFSNFWIEFTDPCLVANFTPGVIPDIEYTIGSGNQTNSIQEFSISNEICGPINYKFMLFRIQPGNITIYDPSNLGIQISLYSSSFYIQTDTIELGSSNFDLVIVGSPYHKQQDLIASYSQVYLTENYCTISQVMISPMPNVSYVLGSGPMTFQLQEWSTIFSDCLPFNYSAQSNLFQNGLLFFSNFTRSFTLESNDSKIAGSSERVIVSGRASFSNTSQIDFFINFQESCQIAYLTPVSVQNGVYMVGSVKKNFAFSEWIISNSNCGTVSYSITSNKGNLPISAPQISFDPFLRSIDFFTTDSTFAQQDFIFTVNGSNPLVGWVTKQFTVSVFSSFVSIPPYFLQDPQPQTVIVGSTLTFKLPEIINPNLNIVKVSVNLICCNSFVKFDSKLLSFIVNPMLESQIGLQSIEISIADSVNLGLSRTYTQKLNLLLPDQVQTNSTNTSTSVSDLQQDLEFYQRILMRIKQMKNLTASISAVSELGVFTLCLNDSIHRPKTIQIFSLEDSLELTIVPNQESKDKPEVSDWSVIGISTNCLLIQVSFQNPREVSTAKNYDVLKVLVVKNQYFVNSNLNSVVPLKAIVLSEIPPQLDSSRALVKMLSEVSKTIGTVGAATLGLSAIIQIFLNLQMKKLWMLMLTLQILIHFPMLGIGLPSNVLLCINTLKDIANLQIIPVDTIKTFFISKLTNGSSNRRLLQNDSDYKSESILLNFGIVFIFIAIAVLFGLIVLCLRALAKKYQKVMVLCVKIYDMIFFSTFIRSFLQGYLKFCVAVLLAIQKLSISPIDDIVSAISTLLMFSVLVLSPILLILFVKSNEYQLNHPKFRVRFETLYLNMKMERSLSKYLTFLFFIRRMVFALSIVFLKDFPGFQISINFFLSAGLLIFVTKSMPYDTNLQNFFELYNEATIFPYTLGEISADTGYNIGYAIISLILLNAFANWVSLIVSLVFAIFHFIRNCQYKIRQRFCPTKLLQKTSQLEMQIEVQQDEKLVIVDLDEEEEQKIQKDVSEQANQQKKKKKKQILKRHVKKAVAKKNDEIQNKNSPFNELIKKETINQSSIFRVNPYEDMKKVAESQRQKVVGYDQAQLDKAIKGMQSRESEMIRKKEPIDYFMDAYIANPQIKHFKP